MLRASEWSILPAILVNKLKRTVRFSIRLTVVAVFVLATSITAIIATSLQYYFSEKMTLESNVQHFNMTTQSVADYLVRVNEKSENSLNMMVKNTSLVGDNFSDKTELRNVLSEIMELNPLFYAFFMGYNNGDFYELINLDSGKIARDPRATHSCATVRQVQRFFEKMGHCLDARDPSGRAYSYGHRVFRRLAHVIRSI